MWDMTARGVFGVEQAKREQAAGVRRNDLFGIVTGTAELLEPLIGGSVFQPIKLRRYTQMPMAPLAAPPRTVPRRA
jgi:hypothetical protein